MKLTKFEQSGFILETNSGYKLALDIGAYTPVEKLTGISVDAMLISHLHSDHCSPEQIRKLAPSKLYLNQECLDLLGEETLTSEIIIVKLGEKVDINGLQVELFDVDHGPNVKVRPKENFGFLLEVDGQKIYFAGDMFFASGRDVTNLEVDYALIPIGGFYTFGPSEALAFVKQFKKIGKVIPMHYVKTPETREEFVKLAMKAGIQVENQALP